MYCPNCDKPLQKTEYEAKISDHSTEVIKTLMSLYVAGFGFYFTLAAVYFGFRTATTSSPDDIDFLKYLMMSFSGMMILVTWFFRHVVEKTFRIYERNMLVVAGLQEDRIFSTTITSLIRFGKTFAYVIYVALIVAIFALHKI